MGELIKADFVNRIVEEPETDKQVLGLDLDSMSRAQLIIEAANLTIAIGNAKRTKPYDYFDDTNDGLSKLEDQRDQIVSRLTDDEFREAVEIASNALSKYKEGA